MTIVRTTSHRSRDRLKSLLGAEVPQEKISFQDNGSFYDIPDHHLDNVLKIKGIKKAKPKGELRNPILFHDRRGER